MIEKFGFAEAQSHHNYPDMELIVQSAHSTATSTPASIEMRVAPAQDLTPETYTMLGQMQCGAEEAR